MLVKYLSFALFLTGLFLITYIVLYKIFIGSTLNKKLKLPKMVSHSKPSSSFLASLSSRLTPAKSRLLKAAPHNFKKRLESSLLFSGTGWQLGDVILLKVLFLVCLTAVGLLLGSKLSGSLKLMVILLPGGIGFFVPDVILIRKAEERRQSIRRYLPPFIDYLTIAVEAGLGLDMAIMRVIGQIKGPLAEEIANSMTEIRYGKPKREAFKSLTLRVNIPEFTSFINALINGEQLGVSLGTILRVQSLQIREKRKQKIQEMAYKIPVKLTFPLVLFIFPGLFIVLLGPALIQIFDTLLK